VPGAARSCETLGAVSDGLPSAPGDPARPALRASDADRERVVELLRGAGGDGRLDVDELDERVSAAYASRTVAALEALTADLLPAAPQAHPAAAPGGVVVRPGPGGTSSVISIMGGSEIRVPDGVDVHVSKLGIMGGHDVKLSPDPPPPGAPVIHIKMLAIMGGGEVTQGRKKPRRPRGQLDR
jgi:hypothetical protein